MLYPLSYEGVGPQRGRGITRNDEERQRAGAVAPSLINS